MFFFKIFSEFVSRNILVQFLEVVNKYSLQINCRLIPAKHYFQEFSRCYFLDSYVICEAILVICLLL